MTDLMTGTVAQLQENDAKRDGSEPERIRRLAKRLESGSRNFTMQDLRETAPTALRFYADHLEEDARG